MAKSPPTLSVSREVAQDTLSALNDYVSNGDLTLPCITEKQAGNMNRKQMDAFLLGVFQAILDASSKKPVELDVAGNPKAELTILEDQAIKVLNTIKGMADGGFVQLPVEVQAKIDAVLMVATVRRVGVR